MMYKIHRINGIKQTKNENRASGGRKPARLIQALLFLIYLSYHNFNEIKEITSEFYTSYINNK